MANTKEQTIPFMVDVFPAIVKKEYIDTEMTEKVRNHISQNSNDFLDIEEPSNKNFLAFEKTRFIFEDLLSCDDVASPYYDNVLLVDKLETSQILSSFRIKMTSCMAFSLRDKSSVEFNHKTMYRKYLVFVFSNTVLLFINPCNKPITFLCALKPNAVTVDFKTITVERTVTVYETTREPIEYYKKFNPVPDSKIHSMHWEVTNSDGSRSFRGGLKPENNPLHITLEYGVITLSICSGYLEYGFSNSELAKKFADTYSEYINTKLPILDSNDLRQEELYNTALNTVKEVCKAPKKGLLEWYKDLSPLMKFLAPILIVFGGLMSISILLYIIEMLIALFLI